MGYAAEVSLTGQNTTELNNTMNTLAADTDVTPVDLIKSTTNVSDIQSLQMFVNKEVGIKGEMKQATLQALK